MSEPGDLDGFPRVNDGHGSWYRAHRIDRGPWWFSSDRQGRFDLDPPYGTCYLASDVGVAVRERLGDQLIAAGVVSTAAADTMVVSALRQDTTDVADLTSKEAAGYGVTREAGAMEHYRLPQAWAAALQSLGYTGLRYWPRFSPAAGCYALAVFGGAGADDAKRRDPRPLSGRQACEQAGIAVHAPPHQVEITNPHQAPPPDWGTRPSGPV